MQVSVFAPSMRLAPFVRAFTVVETDEEATRVLIPEPGIVIGFRYRGSATLLNGDTATRVADAAVTGFSGTARRMRTSAGGGMVLAMFHATGAAQFFTDPLHELFGATAALDPLVPRADLDRVASRVAEATDSARRIAIVEQFLLARMQGRAPDPVVSAAVRALRHAHGALRIGTLSRALAISQDPLEKRFRRVVGASPKQLASLLRVRHTIETYRPGASLSSLAFEAGYCDQSHFTREFRSVTGEPPGRFFGSAAYC